MATVNFSLGQVNITQHLLIIAREVAAPSTEVARQSFPPPQPTSRNVTFSGLNPVTHYFDFRESSDGVLLGTLLGTFVIDVKNNQIIAERRYYRGSGVGTYDPPAGSDTITDPYFSGKNITGVFKENFRYLIPGEEFTITGSTITLLNGHVVSLNEVISVEISYTSNTAGNSYTPYPKDTIAIVGEVTIDASYYYKMGVIDCPASICPIHIPDVLTIPDGTVFGFNTHNGTQRYANIELQPGQFCKVNGVNRNIIYMGKGECLVLIKKGTALQVVFWDGDFKRVGEIIKSEVAPLNSLPEVGGWYDIAQYPRLFYWYINSLPVSYLGTGGYPFIPTGQNVTKFIIDGVNSKFWVPNTGGYFERILDADGDVDTDRILADRIPGNIQQDEFKAHNHGFDIGNGTQPGNKIPDYNPTDGNIDRDDAETKNTGGNETRPKNILRNSYRII